MITNNILVVDDCEVNHILIGVLLTKFNSNIHVQRAYDGQEALNFLNEDLKPGLILLDLNMPGMNGFEFLEAYDQLDLHNKPPVIVLSSSIHEKDQMRSSEFSSVVSYITKPLTMEKLEDLSFSNAV